jgi:glucose/arabinose dehydrogenase
VRGATVTVAAAAALLSVATSPAGAARYPTEIVGKFKDPTYVATPPAGRDRLFVVERRGVIRVVRRGKILKRPFLDIHGATMDAPEDQRGMFSMAFAPDYARTRRFYVMYVRTGDVVEVDEFLRSKANASRALAKRRRRVIDVGKGGVFHHGGQLQFGPDGLLYASTGVSDHPAWAQDAHNLHGKILRIDPTAPGSAPQVFASGLRNPWRFSFDRLNGDMAIGDVGVHSYEEVDYLPAGSAPGANFGFPVFEGRHRMSFAPTPLHYVPPVIEHSHDDGYCAVMGGYVVRDRALGPLYGRYVYGDACQGSLRSAVLRPDGAIGDRRVQKFGGLVSFGEDNRGRIYLVTNYGRVYRLAPKPKR